MQQATPAPTERGSPPRGQPKQEDDNADGNTPDDDYPEPPKNVDSAPFYVLSTLFDKLQNERKPEKRRKLLDSWFNVCIKPRRRVYLQSEVSYFSSTGVKRRGTICTRF